jgi:multiple sugar transport system permease protein
MATVVPPAPAGARLSALGDRQFKYLLVWPAVLVLLLIGLFPIIYTLMVSFQNINMFDEDTSFNGLLNYARLFSDARLWESLLHTFVLTAIALPLELILGLAMAYLFLERMPGRQVFVALLVLPTVISPVIAGAIWRLLFDNRFGPVNQVLGWIAGEPVTILWTVNPAFVYPAILIAEVWQWTPFMVLIMLAGLRSLPKEPFEAAAIDGATATQVFFKLTLPMMSKVIAIAVLIRGIDLFRAFDYVKVMTDSGPGTATETLTSYAGRIYFGNADFPYASTIALMTLILVIIVSFVFMKVCKVKL